MNCTVSIVIPFYNRKDYTRIMVESIVSQTYNDWELLMVDDGCQDGTDDLIKKFANIDDRIKYYRREDYSLVKGACSSRNIGLCHAVGKYIIFFDSDDWIHPDCLKNRVEFMNLNPHLDFAVFPYYNYVDKNLINGSVVSGVPIGKKDNDLFNLAIRNLPFTVVSNIYRTQSLRDSHIEWDEHLLSLQDADFNITSLLAGLSYEYCTNYGFDYYVRMKHNRGSVSHSIRQTEHLDSHLYYFSKQKKRIELLNNPKLNKGITLLSYSIYLLLKDDRCSKRKLLEAAKCKELKARDLLYEALSIIHIPPKLISGLLFYNLSSKFRVATKQRGVKGKVLYEKSRKIIYEIESLMLLEG